MEKLKSENVFEIKSEKESFKEDIPALALDINLFKLLLTPSELYVFKIFLSEIRPLNIREIYGMSIDLCYGFVFPSNTNANIREKYKFIWNTFINAGYGGSINISEKEKQKFLDLAKGVKKTESETKFLDLLYKEFVKYKIKNPSYDRIKTIVTSFEKRGIVQSRKEASVTLYALNPKIYLSVKDKRDDILKL